MDLSNYNPRDEVCESDGWGFIGVLEDGTKVAIGAYSKYCDGSAHANAWMKSTPRAASWEAEKLYVPVRGED